MTVCSVLKRAREIISDPSKWTTSSYARDKNGDITSPNYDDAVCFCSLGAVRRAARELGQSSWDAQTRLESVAKKLFHGYTVVDVNDAMGHDSVIAMFDEAIKECQP